MKFKSKKKDESSSKSHNSKAVDDHLEEEIHVWAGDSFTSIASSITAPPSQTASFYKKVLGSYGDDNFEFASSVDGSDMGSVQGTNRSDDDDNLSWADSRSRDSSENGGDSERAVSKKTKKKKKKFKKKLNKLFGGTIKEDHDAENEDAAPPRRGRRLSLFGNSSGHGPENMGENNQDNEVSRYSSTDGEFSINQSDDGAPSGWSQEGSNDDLGYEEATPSISRGKSKRRGSLGAFFSKKEEQQEHNNGVSSGWSQDGSNDDLGYEEAVPTVSRGKAKRRGSLGGLFSKKEDDQEHIGGGRVRRGSLTGMVTSSNHNPPDAQEPAQQVKPNRRRRNSLFGSMSTSEHVASNRCDQDSANDNTLTATSSHTVKKKLGRRNSLTGSNYNRGSTKSMGPPKEPHWIVNQERTARGMPPFEKNVMLDTLAKSMSNEMAVGLPPTPTEFYGNVGRGSSLQNIHATIMGDRGGISRKNILSERFTEFGMAVTQGPNDGQYYMVALFQ